MKRRKTHLRHNAVVHLGHTTTFCGRVIRSAPSDMSGAVITFGDGSCNLDVTVHGALVDCPRCLKKMRITTIDGKETVR